MTGTRRVAVPPDPTRSAMPDATAARYGVGAGTFAGSGLGGGSIESGEVAGVVGFCCSRPVGVADGTVAGAEGGFR